jgi:hypothetical protein
MRLLTCFLVASIFPALAQTTFKIQSLGTPASAIREHFAVTGDTNGALAVSPTDVFYNGDTATGRFSVDLQSAQQLPPATTRYFALVSDLADGSVYEFVNRAGSPPVDTRLNPSNVNSRPLTHLKNVASGSRVNLSASITLSGNEAIFAGYGRVVIVDGTTVYDIALPSGTITQWTVPALSLVPCEQWMSWGVAEFFDNALHLAYVRTNRIISRTRVPDGVTSDILTTNGQGLRNMCAFSVLPSQNRWYFQHSDASVLGGQNVNGNNDEFLGYAPATFVTTTDSVPPTTTLNPTTQPNANDWYSTSVTVSVGANDTGGSGVKNTQCSINGGAHQIVGSSISLASEGKNTLSCFSTDNANNIESPAVTLTVKIDSVAPAITLSNRTAPNSQGWNNTNVIVNWACSDSGSGPVAPTVSNTLSTEGTDQSSTGTCTDVAGNTATNQQTKINIDKTPPAIEWGAAAPAANAAGWNNTNISVVYSAADSLSGMPSGTAIGNVAIDFEGQGLTGSITLTDIAGNTATYTTQTFNVDKTAPTIVGSRLPAANGAGWNNVDVTVNFACTDALSGLEGSGPPATTLGEGANQSVTKSCMDKAGNSATAIVSDINVDKTAPTIEGSRLPLANAAGWNNVDVTVSFSCADTLSGPDGVAPMPTMLGEGANQSVMKSCVDKAGNSASATVSAINIDKTAPVANPSLSPAANGFGWNNTNVTVNFGWSDALSGLGVCTATQSVTDEGTSQSASATCTDKAGNSFTATKSGINLDKTAPTIEGSRLPLANAAGWNNVDVTVSFSCADTLSGPDGAAPEPTTLGEGANQSVTKSCVDKAGNSASATVTAINIDKTAPMANPSLFPAANGFGWNNTNVTVNFGWSDALSGLGACTATQSVANEGTNQTASATCVDRAGNSFTATKSGINLDKTAPTITYTSLPAANAAGWNNTDVTVTFMGADSLSGLVGCSGPFALTTEGAGQTTTGVCTDKAGNSVTASSVTNIDKTAPLPTAIAGTPNPVAAGTSLKVTAKVIDALASGRVSGAEYMVENGSWTQLSPVDGTYNSPSEDVFANVTAGRTPGVYDLCVRATDVAGNTGPSDCVFVVIYDPNGGFVTGGGWITSPIGAYPLNPALTGKANFGFVSKYLKGATVPTGETQFEFKLASITFQSTVYEWLTIAGARAQYKGSGKINGSGDYGFLLTAIDGETNGGGGADKFRIKIWDKVNSNNIVYDNQLGVSDDSNPTTILGGGSIVIHTNTK